MVTSKITTTETSGDDVDMDDIEEETREIMEQAAADMEAMKAAEVTQVKVKVSD